MHFWQIENRFGYSRNRCQYWKCGACLFHLYIYVMFEFIAACKNVKFLISKSLASAATDRNSHNWNEMENKFLIWQLRRRVVEWWRCVVLVAQRTKKETKKKEKRSNPLIEWMWRGAVGPVPVHSNSFVWFGRETKRQHSSRAQFASVGPFAGFAMPKV